MILNDKLLVITNILYFFSEILGNFELEKICNTISFPYVVS